MGDTVDRHERIALTNRYVEIDGRPAIPVSGELHYSRVPRDEWEERLRLLRSGGITVVATYVFWNHHEVEPGRVSFDGRLDLAAFIALCDAIGLLIAMVPSCGNHVPVALISAVGVSVSCQKSGIPIMVDVPSSRSSILWSGVSRCRRSRKAFVSGSGT